MAKRPYNLLWNERFCHEEMSEGLSAISKTNVDKTRSEYLVIASNPVSFEKPYTEDVRVQILERMKRLFSLLGAGCGSVCLLSDRLLARYSRVMDSHLGRQISLDNDLDGPYLVLRGLLAPFRTVTTLSFMALQPFPRPVKTYR